MCDRSLRRQVPTTERGLPGALVLMHLKQPVMDARVHASGNEGQDLQASARQGMFIVSIAIVGSDAASVPER